MNLWKCCLHKSVKCFAENKKLQCTATEIIFTAIQEPTNWSHHYLVKDRTNLVVFLLHSGCIYIRLKCRGPDIMW